MCHHKGLTASAEVIEERYDAKFETPENFTPTNHVHGWQFPLDWVITRKDPSLIKHYRWGLIPHWARSKEEAFEKRKGTLNARLDTLDKLPSFRDAEKFRCLIPVTHFYEHQWTDLSKKNCPKNVFKITMPGEEVFSIAGIYTRWIDPADKSEWFTYSMVMTDANPVMKIVHNSAERMPVVLNRHEEKEWLSGRNKDDFANRDHIDLTATMVQKLGDLE